MRHMGAVFAHLRSLDYTHRRDDTSAAVATLMLVEMASRVVKDLVRYALRNIVSESTEPCVGCDVVDPTPPPPHAHTTRTRRTDCW